METHAERKERNVDYTVVSHRELVEILDLLSERLYSSMDPPDGRGGLHHHAGVAHDTLAEAFRETLRPDLSQCRHVPRAHLSKKDKTPNIRLFELQSTVHVYWCCCEKNRGDDTQSHALTRTLSSNNPKLLHGHPSQPIFFPSVRTTHERARKRS